MSENKKTSFRVGEGIGIQLSSLYEVIRTLSDGIVLFVFTEDIETFEIDDNGKKRIISVKKGDSFFDKAGRGSYFFEAQNLIFDQETFDAYRGKFREKHISRYTLQDVSDLARYYMRREFPNFDTLVQTPMLHQYQYSDPFDCSYVICPRNVEFNDLLSGLNQHIQQKKVYIDSTEHYVWIDIFSSSLHQDKEESNEEELADSLVKLESTFAKFNETVVFFDSFESPMALKRLWCVWELYMASKAEATFGVPLTIAFPSKLSISEAILVKFDNLILTVVGLDPTALESSNSGTSAALRKKFTHLDEGFVQVISDILRTLCSWLTSLVLREYNTTYDSRIVRIVELYLDVGLFLVNIKNAEGFADAFAQEARRILQDERYKKYFFDTHYAADVLCKAKLTLLISRVAGPKKYVFISERFSRYGQLVAQYENTIKNMKGNMVVEDRREQEANNSSENVNMTQGTSDDVSKASTLKNRVKRMIAIQSRKEKESIEHLQVARGYRNRTRAEVAHDLRLHLYVAQKNYEEACKMMHDMLEKQRNGAPERLYGGLSRASLNFRLARGIFDNSIEDKNRIAEFTEEYGQALESSKEGKLKISVFLYEKIAYYYSLSQMINSKANTVSLLRNHFFKPRGKSMKNISPDNPYIIGCSKRAAQVFFLLAVSSPKKHKKETFEKVATRICEALYGTKSQLEDNSKFLAFMEEVKGPIRKISPLAASSSEKKKMFATRFGQLGGGNDDMDL